jgi:hypothetical protein
MEAHDVASANESQIDENAVELAAGGSRYRQVEPAPDAGGFHSSESKDFQLRTGMIRIDVGCRLRFAECEFRTLRTDTPRIGARAIKLERGGQCVPNSSLASGGLKTA